MPRQYLYVPYEDRVEVERLGALWDRATLRWYLTARHNPDAFSRWLGPDTGGVADAPRHPIQSDDAYVTSAMAHCRRCAAEIAVIAIFCQHGQCHGEALEDFSVIHITSMEAALERQLSPWPTFRRTGGVYRNHCPQCQSPQEDMDLHCEAEGAFFRMSAAARARMTMTRLEGAVRLSGEETFEL